MCLDEASFVQDRPVIYAKDTGADLVRRWRLARGSWQTFWAVPAETSSSAAEARPGTVLAPLASSCARATSPHRSAPATPSTTHSTRCGRGPSHGPPHCFIGMRPRPILTLTRKPNIAAPSQSGQDSRASSAIASLLAPISPILVGRQATLECDPRVQLDLGERCIGAPMPSGALRLASCRSDNA